MIPTFEPFSTLDTQKVSHAHVLAQLQLTQEMKLDFQDFTFHSNIMKECAQCLLTVFLVLRELS